MEMLDLVQEYRNKLQTNSHDVSCLLFALQIPSICSRIDFPQTLENTGKCEDGKLYRSNGKMLQVVDELNDYSANHPFDITQYI